MEESKPSDGNNSNHQLHVVLGALLDAAGDKEGVVRDSVCVALKNIAIRNASLIINAVHLYRPRNLKLSTSHVLIILYVLEHLAQDRRQDLSEESILKLIEISVKELTRSDAQQQVQDVASSILISLGSKHCTEVLKGLLPELDSGREPQPCVVKTFGHLATANISACIPVIKVTLDIIIPMMANIRSEPLRIAFSVAIGRFSEAILECSTMTDDNKDKEKILEAFSEQLCQAYDIIANSWVQGKETKVTESSIKAMGSLFVLLPESKAISSTGRAVTCLLSAYKRPYISHHVVTQCLASVLRAAPPQALQQSLDAILFALGNMVNNLQTIRCDKSLVMKILLFSQVVVPPDYTLPHTVKQHSEVLRCYDHLGAKFMERVADLMIRHLRMGTERDKIESLIVCAHLISSSQDVLRLRMPEIASSLRSVLGDPSVKVKKALVKTIISMACKGYASDSSDFIEFLVRHSIPNISGNEYAELASMCESTLQLISTTVDNLAPLLWVTLLRLTTDPTYDQAMPVIMQNLARVASKVDHDKEYPGEPSREAVLSRCFVLLGSPLDSNRGPSILTFLQQYSSFVSLHISDLWAHKLPQLINYLQVSEWCEREWESLLLELVNNTVTTVSCHDGGWPVRVANELSQALGRLSGDEAGVALSALAITTAVIEDKATVSGHLDLVIEKLRAMQPDVKRCSRAIGILSTAHLDMVLARLESIAHSELNKRNSRLLGLMKDTKAEAEMERCREALLHCYASIAQRCPLMELLPKMDNLTDWITNQITIAKGGGREAALEAILNFAESLVRHKTESKHRIKNRSQILDVIMRQLQSSKPDPISLQATAALVKLPPDILMEAKAHIMKTCFDSVISQEIPTNGFENSNFQQTLKCLGDLVEELLANSSTPETLMKAVSLLEPWLKHRNVSQRHSAIITYRALLLSYYHHLKPGYQNPALIGVCGELVGTAVVRVFDSAEEVGRVACHCAGVALAISDLYDGVPHTAATERLFETLPEENVTFHVTKVMLDKLPSGQLHKLTARLLDGLTDSDATAASNASDVLTAVFTIKGQELFHHINDILGSLLLTLTTAGSGGNLPNGVAAVIALAKHHPKMVLTLLLKQSLPFHSCICECWKNLAGEQELSQFALDYLLQVIVSSELYDDYSNSSPHRPKIAALQPLAAVSGLSEMVVVASLNVALRQRLSQLVPTLICLASAYIDASPPVLAPSPTKSQLIITNRDAYRIQPAKVVKDCLQRILLCVGCDRGSDTLIASPHYQHLDILLNDIPQLALSVCQSFPSCLPQLLTAMNQYSGSSVVSQRIVSIAFYSECLSVESCRHADMSLVDSLVGFLLTAVDDPDPSVKSIAAKGLSAITSLPPSQCIKHTGAVLGALMRGLDDPEGTMHTQLPLEAMRSLSELIPALEEETLLRIQIPLALRLKMFFEKEEIAIRSISLRLLGQVCRSGTAVHQGFDEQILSALITLLLHLSEPEPVVVKSCKFTLRETSTVTGAEKLGSMFRDHLIDDMVLNYDNFIPAIVPLIVSELEDQVTNMLMSCLTYTKSNWPYIRGNAAFLVGILYREMGDELRATVDRDQLTNRLLQLVSDQSREVRSRAALSLGVAFET